MSAIEELEVMFKNSSIIIDNKTFFEGLDRINKICESYGFDDKDMSQAFDNYIKRVGVKNIHNLLLTANKEQQEELLILFEGQIVDLIKSKDPYIKNIPLYLPLTLHKKFFSIVLSNLENHFRDNDYSSNIYYQYMNFFDMFRNYKEEFALSVNLDEFENRLIKDFERKLNQSLLKKYQSKIDRNESIKEEYEDLVNKIYGETSSEIFLNEKYMRALAMTRLLWKNKLIDSSNSTFKGFKEKTINAFFEDIEKDTSSIHNALFNNLINGNIGISDLGKFNGVVNFIRNNCKEDLSSSIRATEELTREQIINYNIKLYKRISEELNKKYKVNNIQQIAFKLFISCGYENAKKLINKFEEFTEIEYLLNAINMQNIKIDNLGKPILDKELTNFLFKSEDGSRVIREMPNYFSVIYNNWHDIYRKLNGNITLERLKDFFHNIPVFLKPNEYKITTALREIGVGNQEVVEKTKQIYSIMRKRVDSSIPKVSGETDDYEYEMLDLDDSLGLAVGYITHCCFLIDGKAKDSLYHSATSENGRIFVVKKDNKIVAQSWVWRNGNVLCFDNVETRGNYDPNKLLQIYEKASEELMQISEDSENEEETIKLVAVGKNSSKMNMPNEQCKISPLPMPVEGNIYSDAKHTQYILAKKVIDSLYLGEVIHRYRDSRNQIQEIIDFNYLPKEYKKEISKKMSSIIYDVDNAEPKINVEDYSYIAYNDDWYIGIKANGNIEVKIVEFDDRAMEECKSKLQEIKDRVPEQILKSAMRKLVSEDGRNISSDTIRFIKSIEDTAYPEDMKTMQEVEDLNDLSNVYSTQVDKITVARNNDWYIIYAEEEDGIEIVDIASLPNKDKEASRREVHEYLTKIINVKASNAGKSIRLNAKQDTSYRMIQRMVSNGDYEVIEDTPNFFDDDETIQMHYLVLQPIIQRDRDR